MLFRSAGQNLVDQRQQCQRAEEVPEIEVLRRVIFGQVLADRLGQLVDQSRPLAEQLAQLLRVLLGGLGPDLPDLADDLLRVQRSDLTDLRGIHNTIQSAPEGH